MPVWWEWAFIAGRIYYCQRRAINREIRHLNMIKYVWPIVKSENCKCERNGLLACTTMHACRNDDNDNDEDEDPVRSQQYINHAEMEEPSWDNNAHHRGYQWVNRVGSGCWCWCGNGAYRLWWKEQICWRGSLIGANAENELHAHRLSRNQTMQPFFTAQHCFAFRLYYDTCTVLRATLLCISFAFMIHVLLFCAVNVDSVWLPRCQDSEVINGLITSIRD